MKAVKLKGQEIHIACLEVHEANMVMRFYPNGTEPDTKCARCDKSLKEDPDP